MNNKSRIPTWIRYAMAGTPGYFSYYILLYTLTEYAHLWYLLSAIIGGLVNFISNFLLQKYWAFQNPDRTMIHKQALKYAIVFSSIALSNIAGLYALTEWLHIWYMLAQLIVSICIAVVGFFLTRQVFKN